MTSFRFLLQCNTHYSDGKTGSEIFKLLTQRIGRELSLYRLFLGHQFLLRQILNQYQVKGLNLLPKQTEQTLEAYLPVWLMQLHDLLFKFLGLIWGQFKITNIIRTMEFWVIVAQLRLDGIRS